MKNGWLFSGHYIIPRSGAIVFQPTLPARGATNIHVYYSYNFMISTHAPRTGSDDGRRRTSAAAKDFNPRSPHGERPPRGGRTRRRNGISTHAPRTGSDLAVRKLPNIFRDFNPRSPHGERLIPISSDVYMRGISTHAPRTGSDRRNDNTTDVTGYFNPRSPHGERLCSFVGSSCITPFQPTLPARGATPQKTGAGNHFLFQPTLPARGATAYNLM